MGSSIKRVSNLVNYFWLPAIGSCKIPSIKQK